MSRASLESYLRSNGVEFRILTFKEHTITVDDAVRQLKVPKERIIKSILFVDERGSPILGVVTGDRKVSEDKIAKVCGAKTLKKARSRAVRSITGYEVGALPPLGHKKQIRTFIDPRVMEHETVFGGGGDINALLEVNPKDIKRLTEAEVVDISTE